MNHIPLCKVTDNAFRTITISWLQWLLTPKKLVAIVATKRLLPLTSGKQRHRPTIATEHIHLFFAKAFLWWQWTFTYVTYGVRMRMQRHSQTFPTSCDRLQKLEAGKGWERGKIQIRTSLPWNLPIALYLNFIIFIEFPFRRRRQRSYVLFYSVFSDVIFYPRILQ